jgi:hypothetical protein
MDNFVREVTTIKKYKTACLTYNSIEPATQSCKEPMMD